MQPVKLNDRYEVVAKTDTSEDHQIYHYRLFLSTGSRFGPNRVDDREYL